MLALAQVGLILVLLGNQNMLVTAEHVQHESWQLSNELRASSDELTRTARTYVVTGDRAYELQYWKILAVRDGSVPRAGGRRVSLRRLMEDIGFTDEELGQLNEAEDNSNALVATEVAAFQAMNGRFTAEPDGTSRNRDDYVRTAPPDQKFAIRIMHDDKYHQDKQRIMVPITEAERMVTQRTRVEVERLATRSRFLIGLSTVVGLLLVALTVGAYLFVQLPVLASTRLVHAELNELASGAAGLSRRLTAVSDDELGDLVAALNQTMDRHEALDAQLRQSQFIVSSSSDMLALLDNKLIYLAANEAYLEAFERERDDLIGHTVSEVFGEEFFNKVMKPNVERCLAGEEVRFQEWFEFPARGRTYMDVAYFPHIGANNEIKGFVVSAREITEGKRAEEELQQRTERLTRANEELERFNRLAVGREQRMIELKCQVNELLAKAGKPPAYDISFSQGAEEANET